MMAGRTGPRLECSRPIQWVAGVAIALLHSPGSDTLSA